MRLVGCKGLLLLCAIVSLLYGWLGSNAMAAEYYQGMTTFAPTRDAGLEPTTWSGTFATSDSREETTTGTETSEWRSEPTTTLPRVTSGAPTATEDAGLEPTTWTGTFATSDSREETTAVTETSEWRSEPTTTLPRVTPGAPTATEDAGLEPTTWSGTFATSDSREDTTTGTETSEWRSEPTTTLPRVTPGAPTATEDATTLRPKLAWPRVSTTEDAVRSVTSGAAKEATTFRHELDWPSVSTSEDAVRSVTPGAAKEATTFRPELEWPSESTTEDAVRSVTSGAAKGTGDCNDKVCKRPRCACASDTPPAGLRVDEMPQSVMLTFDDAVNVVNMAFYRELLNSSRRNKQNRCGIAATFFVSGEYLDYEAVNQLHSWGNEIALHSISHRTDSSYWQTINSTQWEREVLDQRAMLKAFAKVAPSDVTGFRGPFLFTGGDEGFSMLHKYFRYDCTLVHQRIRGEHPVYPYTMDFGFRQSCSVWPCPEGSYPGLWVLPMNVYFPKREEGDLPCAMADACLPQPVTANDTFDYLKSNFDEFYRTNRAPFPVFLHEAYLRHPERKAGYLRFVDWLLEKDDVYLVTPSEVLRFMEDPKPLSAYAKRTCTGRSAHGASTCPKATTCSSKNTPPGGERYMKTCSRCPKNYPWVNNPLGN